MRAHPLALVHRQCIVCRIALLCVATRVIHVIAAVITAKGENMISILEDTATAPAPAESGQPKATKKAKGAKQGAHGATKKGKSAKKASPAKKAPKSAKKAKAVREGSKTDKILELLKRPGGVTAKELMKATGWQPHSVRGFLSGTIRKKMGLTVISTKGEDGEGSDSIKA
jgi:hypothetical protein